MNDNLKIAKTRWRRWLGQKTRLDKPYWATLMDTNWLGWALQTLEKHGRDNFPGKGYACRLKIKKVFALAIHVADCRDLLKLDDLYCDEMLDL